MSDYFNKTEEQEFNDVKNWFKANGTPILVAIVVALAASAGWNFWKKHQVSKAEQTSASYQQVMDAYSQNPEQNQVLVEKFIADNQGTNYAVFAQLDEAKQQVSKGEFEQAKATLSQALSASDDSTLQNVIRFRLANLALQLQQYDEGLNYLSAINDDAWSLRKQILTGDILAAKGDTVAARSAYEQAKQQASPQDQVLLDLRLNNL